jgi:hypothetical protein
MKATKMLQIENHTKRVERTGARMRWLTLGLLFATPAVFVMVIFLDGFAALLPVPRDIALDLSGLSFGGLVAVTALAALKPTVYVLALWFLQDLFGLYRRGLVFDARNVRRVRQIGWTLIGIDLADFGQRVGLGPLLSYLDAARPFLSVGIGLSFAIIGVFVIIIARIMDLGRELKEFEELAI